MNRYEKELFSYNENNMLLPVDYDGEYAFNSFRRVY